MTTPETARGILAAPGEKRPGVRDVFPDEAALRKECESVAGMIMHSDEQYRLDTLKSIIRRQRYGNDAEVSESEVDAVFWDMLVRDAVYPALRQFVEPLMALGDHAEAQRQARKQLLRLAKALGGKTADHLDRLRREFEAFLPIDMRKEYTSQRAVKKQAQKEKAPKQETAGSLPSFPEKYERERTWWVPDIKEIQKGEVLGMVQRTTQGEERYSIKIASKPVQGAFGIWWVDIYKLPDDRTFTFPLSLLGIMPDAQTQLWNAANHPVAWLHEDEYGVF